MLYDALFTLDLPRRVGPPLPTAFWDGVQRLIFTGSWARRAATCTLSSAAVLAGSHSALREVGSAPSFQIVDDAGELFDLSAAPERWGEVPAPWAEILPPRWTEEPCAFRLRAAWQEGGFAVVALIRHAPRHDPEQAALSGAVRVLWAPQELGPRLEARLAHPEFGGRLSRLLRLEGERVLEALARELARAFGGWPSHRGVVRVLAEPVPSADGAGFADLLAGFPEPAVRSLGPIRDALSGWWPALTEDGVEGRWREGRFVPTAEVADAV